MRGRLRHRTVLTQFVVSVLAILVFTAVAELTTSRRFADHMRLSEMARSAQVVDSLQSTYRQPDGWDATAIYALSQVAAFNDVNVAVYDTEGHLLFTVEGRQGDPGAGEGPDAAGVAGASEGSTRSVSPQTTSPGSAARVVESASVVVGGRVVAAAEIDVDRAARVAAEGRYRSVLRRDLVLAAIAAGVAALLVSLLLGRRIAEPLEELSAAAGDSSHRRFEVRVATHGDDEVARLVTAFNSMADRLAEEEQRRRDVTDDVHEELRRPLGEIRARLEALSGDMVQPTSADLDALGEQVERMSSVLESLHALDTLEREGGSAVRSPVDLALAAAEAAEPRRPAFSSKGVALVEELEPAPGVGDHDQMVQVAGRLLDHALGSTPQGGRVVLAAGIAEAGSAGVDEDDTTGSVVHLTVTDDGPGIDSLDLPFIFDHPYRARGAGGRTGAGLSLAVCRALMEAQGGSITAGQAPGGGARFTVLLPAPGRS